MPKNVLFTYSKGIDRAYKMRYNMIKFMDDMFMKEDLKMTFEQAFKRIKTKFENVDAAQLPDMALQITLSDEDCGGTLYAAVRSGILSVEPYDYKDNDAVIDVTRSSLSAILDGKSSIEKEIEKGNLTVKGDLDKVAAVKNAVKAPVKKAPAKKAPAKKTAVKKTAEKKPAKKTPAVKETVKKAAAPEVNAVSVTDTVKKTAAKKPAVKKAPAEKKATK